MGIEPKALQFKAAGKMDFPDKIERELGQKVFDRLPTVHRVGENIVQIEQDTAVCALHDGGDENAVGHLVKPLS